MLERESMLTMAPPPFRPMMFEAVGAKKVTVKYTPSFRYWKKFLALVKNQPQSGRAVVHVEF